MKKYPAPTPVAPTPPAPAAPLVVELPDVAAMVARQGETQDQLAALIESLAAKRGREVRVKIIRDVKSREMTDLVITS